MYDRNNGTGKIQMSNIRKRLKDPDLYFLGTKINLVDNNVLKQISDEFEENKHFFEKDYNVRNTWQWRDVTDHDLTEIIKDMIIDAAESIVNKKLRVNSFKYIDYVEGSNCLGHQDHENQSLVSCVLTIDLSSNLEGGEAYFSRGPDQPHIYPTPIDNGDLLMYSQNMFHGVHEVKKGRRLVAICWLLED